MKVLLDTNILLEFQKYRFPKEYELYTTELNLEEIIKGRLRDKNTNFLEYEKVRSLITQNNIRVIDKFETLKTWFDEESQKLLDTVIKYYHKHYGKKPKLSNVDKALLLYCVYNDYELETNDKELDVCYRIAKIVRKYSNNSWNEKAKDKKILKEIKKECPIVKYTIWGRYK